jgi:hypothetical protein
VAETKKAKAKKAKPKRSSTPASKSKAKSKASNGAAKESSSNGASVKETVLNGAHGAANGLAPVAQKAKLPLLATGAALAGAAAVIATKSTGSRRKVLGVKVPKRSKVNIPDVHMPKVQVPKGKAIRSDVRKAAGAVTDAAKQADDLAKRISKVANSVQTVSETANDAAKKS